MNSRKIKINGLNHQFYFWGNPKKPKLFLFHGWLDTAANFHFLCEHLQDHFYCIAPDFRGYGKSEHGSNPLGYFFYEYITDVHAIFQKFSPREPVKVLGHSLGGAIIGFYAGAFPERVSHFINVEGFAFRANPPERGPEKLRHWIENLHVKPFGVYLDLEHFAKRLTKTNPRLPLERAKFFARYLTHRVQGGVMMSADPLHKQADPSIFTKPMIYAYWDQIKAKCLLVSAELTNMNEWVRVKNFEKEMKERFQHFPKGSKNFVIPQCGHMVHHEKPEELAKIVLDFL
jgi:pimeloyl-ACP methyl ester carboxylesterase